MESWWDEVEASDLMQGDFLKNTFVPIPTVKVTKKGALSKSAFGFYTQKVAEYDVVILTQSCDLENNKVPNILVSPIYNLSGFQDTNLEYKSSRLLEEIRRGGNHGLHMLSSHLEPANQQKVFIVDFKEVYTLPKTYIEIHIKNIGKRLRLKDVYREKLSKAFGDFFSRVAIEHNIPAWKNK